MRKSLSSPRRILNRLLSLAGWSIPLKLLASAIVGVLATSGFIGFFFDLATHSYARYFGFRVPAKGTDFTGLVMLTLWPSALITSAAFSALVYWTLRGVRLTAIDELARSETTQKKFPSKHFLAVVDVLKSIDRRYPRRGIPLLIAGVVVASFVLMWLALNYFVLPRACMGNTRAAHSLFCRQSAVEHSVTYAVALSAYIVMQWRTAAAWWLSTIAAIWMMASTLHGLFDPDFYAGLLRSSGYGGGLPVTIKLSQNEGQTTPIEKVGFMLLRTADAVVLFDEKSELIEEYALSKIDRISYSSVYLTSSAYRLPGSDRHGHYASFDPLNDIAKSAGRVRAELDDIKDKGGYVY